MERGLQRLGTSPRIRGSEQGAGTVLINYAGREINAKIVYYGPGLSGKTTNLECIYASVPQQSRGKMVSMKTRQDRTLFFDFLPLELGEVHGFRTRFLLYTVPGQVFYNATRKLVLKGADAVVFVADSALGKMDENRESLRNLDENLHEQGLSLDTLPFVLQWNKRDLPQLYSVEEMNQALNPRAVPAFEAAAASGHGVYETLHAVSRLLFQRLMNDLRPQGGRAAAPAAGAAAPAPLVATVPPPMPVAQRPAAPRSAPVAPGAAVPVARPFAAQPVAARGPAPAETPRWAGAVDPATRTLTPGLEGGGASPAFGTPASGHVPTAATSSQILDSVQASTRELEAEAAPEVGGSYSSYGHVVDLGAEEAPEVVDVGFIKDPLRKPDPSAAGSRAMAASPPTRTQHVTVTLPRGELKPGSTIRIVFDLKVEP